MKKLILVLSILLLASSLLFAGGGKEEGVKPVRIGATLPLTGGLAAGGKADEISWNICIEDWNAKGGVLGRPVELVLYDDHSNAAEVPGLLTKLITVDKVDFIMGTYATPGIVAGIPVAMEHEMVFFGNGALAPNKDFKYKYFFDFWPLGSQGIGGTVGLCFDAVEATGATNIKVAICGVDNEYGATIQAAAEKIAAERGMEVVYADRFPAPPATSDFAPIIRAIQKSGADMFILGSYPPGTIGLIRAMYEVGYKPSWVGGPMVGLNLASGLIDLGPYVNGISSLSYYCPEDSVQYANVAEFIAKYQKKAVEAGADPLGFYNPPWAYASMDSLLQAIEATGSLDQKVVGDYVLKNGYDSVVGKGKWGPEGEPEKNMGFLVQFKNVQGNDVEEFKEKGKWVIVWPPEVATGKLDYPPKYYEGE